MPLQYSLCRTPWDVQLEMKVSSWRSKAEEKKDLDVKSASPSGWEVASIGLARRFSDEVVISFISQLPAIPLHFLYFCIT